MTPLVIDYTNWRGERAVRRVMPIRIFFGCNEYHPVNQWILIATDVDKGTTRTFALCDIHSMKNASGEPK